MATTENRLLPQAQMARMLSSTYGSVDVAMEIVVNTAIDAAIALGLYTCTASMAGKASQDIQNIMNMLQGLGYTVSLSSTTLTVSW